MRDAEGFGESAGVQASGAAEGDEGKVAGSRPRSMETTRMAFSMVALTTRMTPAANFSRVSGEDVLLSSAILA